jgi:hypothetical protein
MHEVGFSLFDYLILFILIFIIMFVVLTTLSCFKIIELYISTNQEFSKTNNI